MRKKALLNPDQPVSTPGELIPFTKVFLTGNEIKYLQDVLERRHLACNGKYSQLAHTWLEKRLGARAVFLTGAGTLALEMSALLLDLEPGDEVLMPSFTFVTTASAFARAGLVPVFVDIRPDTQNIDETKIESAITDRTRAIVAVHYAGVGCDMNKIVAIARKHNLKVIEDAAHGILAKYEDRYLGTIGDLGVLSFHETKNIVGGEGGALIVNDDKLVDRARRLWHKGTNKHAMELGLVGKYTWTDLGSAFASSEVTASIIYAQLEEAEKIVSGRLDAWSRYNSLLRPMAEAGHITLPAVPGDCEHNGHIFYFLTRDKETRDSLLKHLRENNIEGVFHYIPLHDSPAGQKYGRPSGDLSRTTNISERLIRLPIWPDLEEEVQKQIVSSIVSFFDC
ncbi:MAG: dTDP-4-amino-4,6-dideoxygalactose transaminase [Cyanobacteriota/Melainabacteria group bacterium]